MNNEDIRKWCYEEMRAPADSSMYARGRAILALVDAAEAPPWLDDAAVALGEVRAFDGAPKALNWTQVIEAIRGLKAQLKEAQQRVVELELEVCAHRAAKCDAPQDVQRRVAELEAELESRRASYR